jgi:hypothetical protein
MVFCEIMPVEGTVSSTEQKTRLFFQTDVQEFHLCIGTNTHQAGVSKYCGTVQACIRHGNNCHAILKEKVQ